MVQVVILHKDTKSIYALKKIKVANCDKAKNEINILKHCQYFYISSLHEVYESDKHIYIIMEYYSKHTLFELITRKGILSENCIQYYLAYILQGLEFLHANGVIHRDIKLENIFIKENGQIVIGDFDLSVFRAKDIITKFFTLPYTKGIGMATVPTTECRGVIGTLPYLAPEVINQLQYNYTVDFWSLGVVIYELLCGETRFEASQEEQIINNIKSGDFDIHISQPVSDTLIDLIEKLLTTVSNRLGSTGGAVEIKDHPFFNNVDFTMLHEQYPP
jgi:serine/threonine protein kinase